MVDDVGVSGIDAGGPWPGEWLRGLMEVCVLRVIADGPTYGYAIATALERAGFGIPKGGTLYPLLGRCEQAHWVLTRWGPGDCGPGRKFYELTPAGRDHLHAMSALWEGFAVTLSAHLALPHHVSAPQRTAATRQEGTSHA